ncbi:MAG: polymer-forming cytoskeletal protein [Zavarzinia sp.]|nr:polymer-forming cytoskeletal protein [Zavarzinia sp.]
MDSPPSLLAENLTIEGNLAASGDLQIDGTVKGDIACRTLTLGEEGTVIGEVKAETVHIRGRIEGRIIAASVELASTAVITGDILHDSLGVEVGARIDGHLKRRATTEPKAAETPKDEAPKGDGKPSLVVTNP